MPLPSPNSWAFIWRSILRSRWPQILSRASRHIRRELEFIRQVPADWSDSRLIAGEVGDYAIFARKDRGSEDWYVGGVNDATERTLELPFDSLEDGVTYVAQVWKDGPEATYLTDKRHDIAYETVMLTSDDTYTVRLAPGGGFAMRLVPQE